MNDLARNALPRNLLGAMRYFSDPDVCVEFVAGMRWPNGVVCPHCASDRNSYLKSRRIWKCLNRECYKQFSVKTQSVFEDSPVPLDKWLTAVWMVVNCRNGVSSHEIARTLKVTQKTAWFMLHRIRLALRRGNWEKMGGSESGPIEVDEAYIGGVPKNRHLGKRMEVWKQRTKRPNSYGRRVSDKVPVFGMLDRETRQIRASVIPEVRREVLMNEILNNIHKGSTIYSDALRDYASLPAMNFVHETVTHVKEYVRGEVHTQGIENFWSLLKRGLRGTYVAVEPYHMDRYLDEQCFRYNNRTTKDNPLDDRDRFMLAVSQIANKRLTYAELTGKVGETEPF
jgi:transposase-like protein